MATCNIAEMMENAKCFDCLSTKQLLQLKVYLLCQILLAYTTDPPTPCPDCLILGKATGTGDANVQIGLFTYMNAASLVGITALRIDAVTNSEGYDIEVCDDLVTIEFPNLTSINGGGYLAFDANAALATLDLGVLTTIAGDFQCTNNVALTNLNISNLTTVGGILNVGGNNVLPTLDLGALISVGGIGFFLQNNTAMTTLDLGSFVPLNGQTVDCIGCALIDTSVNMILARCVANPAYVTGLVRTSGGTNSAPTGQGILDKATLIARGVTVTTN
jgi:hypothetical protein